MLISLSEWTLVEMRGGDHPWLLIGPRYLTWLLIGCSSAPGLAVAPVSCCFPITMLIETQCDPGPGPAAIKHDPDKMCLLNVIKVNIKVIIIPWTLGRILA